MGLFDRRRPKHDVFDESPEFTNFVDQSMEGLRLQTEAHAATWGLGRSDRWDFSQDDGLLVFTFRDKIVEAPAQIIGSFDSRNDSWLWAWANDSLDERITQDAQRVRAYGEEHGLARLTQRGWHGEELDGWKMAALANRLCESNGAYRGPAGSTFVFFTFGRVQIAKR